MDDLTQRVTSKIFDPDSTPATSISIKVTRRSLCSVSDKGLKKTNWFERKTPINLSRWVNVEIAELGTDDSVFFVPEHPNVDRSHQRSLPAQYVKVNPAHYDDIVHRDDDFEVSFVGMSVAPMDVVGNNEILLCSLTREDNSTLEEQTKPEMFSKRSESTTTGSEYIEENEKGKTRYTPQDKSTERAVAVAGIANELNRTQIADTSANTAANIAARTVTRLSANASIDRDTIAAELDPVKREEQAEALQEENELDILSELPTALTVHAGDVPFLHYDPEVDGHDTGSSPDAFVPIPGSKRVYLQRRGGKADHRDVSIRFIVMEVDKLSEEQLIAIKSLEEIGKSVGKAAATVPYLKFISWILKFANFLGRSALKKVAEPEHVLSKDMVFLLADPVASETRSNENTNNRTSTCTKREQYGNYLRYGYYFFLNTTVDAKLYAQTGASSQNVPLLLRRVGYNARFALKNEREFFPLTGVSYVVAKVTRGCSPLNLEQRVQMKNRHRTRLVKLLKKYTGKLENTVK